MVKDLIKRVNDSPGVRKDYFDERKLHIVGIQLYMYNVF